MLKNQSFYQQTQLSSQTLQKLFLNPFLFESNDGKFKSKGLGFAVKVAQVKSAVIIKAIFLEKEWSGG